MERIVINSNITEAYLQKSRRISAKTKLYTEEFNYIGQENHGNNYLCKGQVIPEYRNGR